MKKLWLAVLLVLLPVVPVYGAGYDDLSAGIQFFDLHSYPPAISFFDKALAAGDLVLGLQYVAHLDRAESYEALGNYEAAVTDFTASLALRPQDIKALFYRAQSLIELRKYDEAGRDMDAFLSGPANSFFAASYLQRAAIDAIHGQDDLAMKDAMAGLDAMGSVETIPFSVGKAEWMAGRPEEAEQIFAANLPANPPYLGLWLAMAQAAQGKEISSAAREASSVKAWPGPIMNFFLGNMTREALLGIAQVETRTSGEQCDANFYAGEWLALHHDEAAAKPMLDKAVRDCPFDGDESLPAHVALAKLP